MSRFWKGLAAAGLAVAALGCSNSKEVQIETPPSSPEEERARVQLQQLMQSRQQGNQTAGQAGGTQAESATSQ